jgi:hypothetical protein
MNDAAVDQPETQEFKLTDRTHEVIGAVLAQLGRPAGLERIDAKPLWNNQYRVNLYCRSLEEGSIKRLRIAESFFVTWTAEGIVANPPIAKKYR